jgi:hypothetical protein
MFVCFFSKKSKICPQADEKTNFACVAQGQTAVARELISACGLIVPWQRVG